MGSIKAASKYLSRLREICCIVFLFSNLILSFKFSSMPKFFHDDRNRGDSKYLSSSNSSKQMSMQIVKDQSISSKQFWKSIEGKILIRSYQWPGNILDVDKITSCLGQETS